MIDLEKLDETLLSDIENVYSHLSKKYILMQFVKVLK